MQLCDVKINNVSHQMKCIIPDIQAKMVIRISLHSYHIFYQIKLISNLGVGRAVETEGRERKRIYMMVSDKVQGTGTHVLM